MSSFKRLIAACGVASIAAAVVGGATAYAAGYVVTNLDDSGPGSLRQAIVDANTNAGLDEITFAAGLSGEISLTSGSIEITDSVTISGPGPLDLSVAGNASGSVLYTTSAADVVISGLTITNGGGIGTNSGGVYVNNAGANVTIRNSVLSGNAGFYGGGASAYSGQLVVEDSRITGNTASGSGGGIATASTTTLERVEISGNTAALSGGGVFLNSGSVVINNSTISGNSSSPGGGIYKFSTGAQLTVNSSTIVGNNATGVAAGTGAGGTASLSHSIVSGNTGADLSGQIDVAWSLITDASGATVNDLGGNAFGVDPQLEGLDYNGGLTKTHFPQPSSPAIDAGDPALASPPALDQRGARRVARPTSNAGTERIDIGAVEVVPMDDEGQTSEDTTLTVADPGVLFSDNRGYTVEVVDQPAHGQVVLDPAGGYTYTPTKDYHGSDSFTYRLVGAGAPDYISTVTIDIASVYDPFQLTIDSSNVVNDGSPVRIEVLGNDSGENLTILSVTQGQLGTVQTDGTAVIYTPNQGATGTDTFDYVASDGTTQVAATVNVTVVAPTTAAPTTVPVAPTTTTPRTVLVLPRTGSSTPWVAALAVGALAVGALFARIGRRQPS